MEAAVGASLPRTRMGRGGESRSKGPGVKGQPEAPVSCPHPSLSFFVCPECPRVPPALSGGLLQAQRGQGPAQAIQQEGRKCSKNLAMASQGSVR